MSYGQLKYEIYVGFYHPRNTKYEYFGSLLSLTKITHCSLIIRRDDDIILLGFDRKHKPRFLDARAYSKLHKPFEIIPMGKHYVSIKQLEDFVQDKHIGDWIGLFMWKYLWQHVYPRHTVRTCATLVCDCLRLCGCMVGIHPLPQTLYKELTDANDIISRSSRSG